MKPGPEDILPTYEREATAWARQRGQSLWELPVLEGCVASRGPGLAILDLGCGSGQPIAQWFVRRGDRVTGVDGAAAMMAEARMRVPQMEAIQADMRTLRLGQRFDIILAFNSFFHLSPEDQRAMFPIFAAHAAPATRLCFTAGPAHGPVWGTVGNSSVYHSSLDPSEYRSLVETHGFDVVW